jgi:hypothetical protein
MNAAEELNQDGARRRRTGRPFAEQGVGRQQAGARSRIALQQEENGLPRLFRLGNP